MADPEPPAQSTVWPESPSMRERPPAGGGTARLFLALWPDDTLRQALHGWCAAWRWPASVALVPPERFHLTLHFLGDLPAGRLPELAQGLAVPCAPFALSFGQGALWPHGIAVLQPDEPGAVPPLAQLHDALRQALTRLALPAENRAFRPHITLARHAQAAVPPTQGPALRWQVNAYSLVRSWPGKAGGYSVVRHYA
jgi:RNA 2',3'-cyclic 3'-phosphodiesterase